MGDLPAMAPAIPTGVPATFGLCPTHAVQLRIWPPDPDRARILEVGHDLQD